MYDTGFTRTPLRTSLVKDVLSCLEGLRSNASGGDWVPQRYEDWSRENRAGKMAAIGSRQKRLTKEGSSAWSFPESRVVEDTAED